MNITINKTTEPKQKPQDESSLGFGKIFTDHMFLMDYTPEKGWYDRSDGKYTDKGWYIEDVNEIYDLLTSVGYKMSDFELSLKDGSHECYKEEA